ncbi:MAG: serine dehydratase beta chain, partial [Rubrimonas sp.]
MFISVFDVFKVGVGPSSSHTMGPMTAAGRFLALLRDPAARPPGAGAPARLTCRLHGSLAFTGKGHATDRAVILGLCGFTPDDMDATRAHAAEMAVRAAGRLAPPDLPEMAFDPGSDLIFDYGPALPLHANAMTLEARDAAGATVARETFYSIGGGFVLTEAEMLRRAEPDSGAPQDAPYPFRNAAEMLDMGARSGLSVARMKRANELAFTDSGTLERGLDRILSVMDACIDRGLATDGVLPGGLGVRRRAPAIHRQLLAERGQNQVAPHVVNDWLSVYAMAVNEENAAGGQVVTAPTNGAAGVMPAVLRYYRRHVPGATVAGAREMLLTAGAIGG